MKKKAFGICLTVAVCCGCMAIVDGILQPGYAVKSAIKLALFLILPLILCRFWSLHVSTFLRLDKTAVIMGLLLGSVTMGVILGAYALLSPYLDLSAIPDALADNTGVTADNFLYVGTYIALCNSFLEEFFFRGFAFLFLKQIASRPLAHFFSAGAFALYHCAILDGWFSPVLFLLIVAALFGCGLLFNFLNERTRCIWVSWPVHLFANLAINLIGMRLLGIL